MGGRLCVISHGHRSHEHLPDRQKKNTCCSAQTEGKPADIYGRFHSNGYTGNGYIYTYPVDGIAYRLKSTARSKKVNEIGDVSTIWYNPAKPKAAQPFHYSSDKVYTIVLLRGIVLIGAVAAQ